MSGEELAFCSMGPGDALRRPSVPPAAMKELARFKEQRLGLAAGTRWFADDLFLCVHRFDVGRLFEYVEAERRVHESTVRLSEIRTQSCGSIRDAPLSAGFRYERGDLFWDLGPYRNGAWAFLFADGTERIEVARLDGYRRVGPALALRIRYASPQGWTTYSPELALDFSKTDRISWTRGAGSEPARD